MNKEDWYMAMRPFPQARKAWVKLLQEILLQNESTLIRQKLKMLTEVDEVGDCILTVDVGEAEDLVRIVMDELVGRYRMEDGQEVAGLVTELVRVALLKCDALQSRLKRYEYLEEAIKEIYEKDIPQRTITIGEAIDHALKLRDEIKTATGKRLELSVSTYSFDTICETITISAYYKPEGEEKRWVMKRAFDRSVLEVDGKGLINHFFIGLKQQMGFTDKHRPAPQLSCENCKYFDMNETFPCIMRRTIVRHCTPACHNFKPKEQ